MATYGSRIYGSFKYSSTTYTTDISVYPFSATSLNYGTIKLSWVYPLSTGNFTSFQIVRSPIGFPVSPDNGDLVVNTTKSTLSGQSLLGLPGSLTDTGAFYDPINGLISSAYTATVLYNVTNSKTVTLVTPNSSIAVGQVVTYTSSGTLTGSNSGSGIVGGTTVVSIDNVSQSPSSVITLSDYATIAAGTTLTFSTVRLKLGKPYYYSAFVLTSGGYWQRVGTALGLSVNNYKTADVMYDSLPKIYTSAADLSSATSYNKNVDLYNFLRTVAVQYDFIKTKVDNAKNRYDVLNLDGKLIPALMDEMGFSYESGLGVQQGRRLLKYASTIYLNKGTGKGIKQFASSFSGYNASIAPIKNLFLTTDCSSFEASDGFWGAVGTQISITNTTAATEGGSPLPYSESSSPAGYPNAQAGYLKATATSAVATTATAYEFDYGVSLDSYTISTTTSNSSTAGLGFITLTTDSEHGFTVGQTVVVQGMSPALINGIWKITAVSSRTFTFYDVNAVSGYSISPTGTVGTVALYNPTLYGVPVTAGSVYTFSIYSQAKTTLRSITMGIKWYDQYGTYLSSSSPTSTNNATSVWTRVANANQTAPSYAFFAVPYVVINSAVSSEVHYFDAAQFEQSASATTYADSRRVDIYLSAPRINQVINSGFELATTNWTATGTSAFGVDASNVYPTSAVGLGTATSLNSAKLTSNATAPTLAPNSTIAVTAGSSYSFSGYIKGPAADTVVLSIVWKTAGGSTISTSTSSVFTLSTAFTRATLSATAPATAATASLLFTFAGTSGDIYYVDSVLFEASATVNAYFDGGTGYNVTDDLVWEQNASYTAGTPSTGRGLYYPNRSLVQNRLSTVIKDYLPIGTNYAFFIGVTST